MTTLTVTVRETTLKGRKGFTGTVTVPGLKATQVARAKDGESLFQSVGALKSVAGALASKLGVSLNYAEPAKKAAKKSVKSRTAKPAAKATKATKTKSKAKSTKTSAAKPDTSSPSSK